MEKHTAIFTHVYNERHFLPRWLEYYGSIFGMNNIYIIDDGSNDGSTSNLPCSVIRRPRLHGYNPGKQSQINNMFAETLLADYDYAIYTDCDEFLVANPEKYTSLKDYINNIENARVAPIGFDIIHKYDEEDSIILSKPILSQRSYARFAEGMCKPVIKSCKTPRWTTGQHYFKNNLSKWLDRDLYLFHLKWYDYEFSHNRIQVSSDPSYWHQNIMKKAELGQKPVGRHARKTPDTLDRQLQRYIDQYNPNLTLDQIIETYAQNIPLRHDRKLTGKQARPAIRNVTFKLPEVLKQTSF